MNNYLQKKLKLHDKKLKYDFLPSMIEIIERPANRLADVILFLTIALIATAIVWAALWEVDIAVTATGSVIPEGGIIAIDSAYGGRIERMDVKDGSFVKAGDVVAVLENAEAWFDTEECRHNLEILQIQREMYGRIYEDLCVEEKEDSDDLYTTDTSAYGEYALLADAILLENAVYEEELNRIENEEEKSAYEKQHRLSVLQNVNTLDVKIYSAEISLRNAEEKLERYTLKAPADGQITQMSMITQGMLVEAGESIGYLIPAEKENMFTAYVPDEDISQIHTGDAVSVRIAAYRDTENEYMEGTIATVGDIALNIDGIGAVYAVGIRIENLPEDLRVGMEGTCDIIVGTRTVLDYFMEPFQDGLRDSLKEK
ncbi:MAG: HlyD family secretion protein [Lachnospiraceae bacterium]|nr:HlyD family secretion protein [Lachnospiraceae bacterium]